MTRGLKNTLSKLTAAVLLVVMLPFCAVDAAAASVRDVWAVDWSAPAQGEYIGWLGNGSSDFSVDAKNYYKDSRYSIKITNKDYNVSYVEKTFDVEPKTTYRFSAMVKYSGYKLDPQFKGSKSGGCIGQAFTYNVSNFVTSEKWTKAVYEFTTGNETEYKLSLQNGIFNGDCKGTVWFSDVKLEKVELTNDWKVLAVTFKNIDVKVKDKSTGKTITYKDSVSNNDIKAIKSMLNNLKTSIPQLSGNKMGIKSIKHVALNNTITEDDIAVYEYGGDNRIGSMKGYRLDESSSGLSKILDEVIGDDTYNQIIVFAPFGEFAGGWGGLCGSYGSAVFTQINIYEGVTDYYRKGYFPESTIIHELLHTLAYRSEQMTSKEVPYLHYATDYGYEFDSKEWFSAQMQSTINGNQGIDPSVYKVPSGKYTLISDDMTTGTGITQSSSFLISLSNLKVSEMPDRTYNGKAQKPDVTITDGKYTLKRGTDYVINYSNNKSVGKATATVTGKGIYTGKINVDFKIMPKSPTVKVTKSGDKLKVSWSKVTGASKYSVWLSKDGKNFEKIAELDKDKLSTTVKYSSKHTYQFAITAYIPEAEGYTPYVYTDAI